MLLQKNCGGAESVVRRMAPRRLHRKDSEILSIQRLIVVLSTPNLFRCYQTRMVEQMGWYEKEERVGQEGEGEKESNSDNVLDDTRDEHVLLKIPGSLAAANSTQNSVARRQRRYEIPLRN